MAIICPTVLAGNSHSFRTQMERVAHFAHRIQIDLMDGEFAPQKSIALENVWWPIGVMADLHIMYQHPDQHLETIINLKPNLVIIHAEAQADFFTFQDSLKAADIKVGLAILADTPIAKIEPVLDRLDHVLIFSGELGKFGGRANLELLKKVSEIESKTSFVEIGWDGGVNQHNAKQLADNGVDVLNVGGFIQRSEHPADAYATLEAIVGNENDS
jgi:ribulose-phosphate 3-epimerase